MAVFWDYTYTYFSFLTFIMISVNNHFSFRSDSIKLPRRKEKTTVLSFSVERLKHTAAWQRPLNLLRYVRGTGNTD